MTPLFGKAPAFNPYAFEYGETLLKPKPKLSPRSQRKSLRLQGDLRATAQYQQECILGQTKEGEEPLSPEDVASIAGTGSLFHDNIDIEEGSDRGSPRITRSSTPVPPWEQLHRQETSSQFPTYLQNGSLLSFQNGWTSAMWLTLIQR